MDVMQWQTLRGKYCTVGETEFSRGSGRTTRAMGAEAIRNAMNDAGLNPADVDGMLSYHGGDSALHRSCTTWA